MLDNHIYNLMMQAVDEHKSIYRIKNMYKQDAKNCKQCLALWEQLEKDKEAHIRQIQDILMDHMGSSTKKQMYYGEKGEKKAEQTKMKRYYGTEEKKAETAKR
ncbi:MAG TPA: hypothetical protein VMT57_00030 [Candidatus Thermoplasmatota archaeon]|nr:hypothetical protein [Candidatus Thermoplasmatota archaeon]